MKPKTPEQIAAIKANKHLIYLANRDTYIAKAKLWSKNNKEKRKEIQYRSNIKRADAVAATRAAWWERNAHKRIEYKENVDKEHDRLRCAEYRKNNPERVALSKRQYKEKNREIINAKNRAYGKNNPAKIAIKAQNRRAKIRAAGGVLSKDIVQRLKTLQKGKCAICYERLPVKGYHIDHIMPLALGGSNKDANAQLTCAPCNLKKNRRHPIDFMRSRGFLL